MQHQPSVGRPRSPSRSRFVAVLPLAVAMAVALVGCAPSGSPSPSVSPSPTSASPGTGGASPSTGASPRPSPSPSPAPSATPVAYVVRSGDTLFSIARRFDTTARSIAFWNRDTYPSLDPDAPDYEPDRIVVGWTLDVWPGQEVDEDDLPPASPAPRPSLSIPPTAAPSSGGVSVVVDHGPRASNAVALTFDLGGRVAQALDIVDWLIEHDVEATVFTTGETGTTNETGKAVLERVAAHPELFSLGNHSWDHPDFSELDPAAIQSQVNRTERAVQDLVGRTTKPFFRPPYGTQDLQTRETIGGLGWSYTVMWDVDTIDWRPVSEGGPTADDIVARVLARAQGGSIVLMHLGGYHTLEALPGLVNGLRERGLEPVTLARLLSVG
jgi:peptidoglycan/xylan/chitin deacetylase (PgdA/CDA1 family)